MYLSVSFGVGVLVCLCMSVYTGLEVISLYVPPRLSCRGSVTQWALRIDTGSLSTHCIQVHNFSAMIVVMVYYTYYESLYFSLFYDIFLILIKFKL